jgi:hypothetical protein
MSLNVCKLEIKKSARLLQNTKLTVVEKTAVEKDWKAENIPGF